MDLGSGLQAVGMELGYQSARTVAWTIANPKHAVYNTGYVTGQVEYAMFEGLVTGGVAGAPRSAGTGMLARLARIFAPQCFAAETKVLTKQGHKAISDVREGDYVWSRSEHGTRRNNFGTLFENSSTVSRRRAGSL